MINENLYKQIGNSIKIELPKLMVILEEIGEGEIIGYQESAVVFDLQQSLFQG